jgi:3-isopropylmalate dehydrogenase
LGDGVGLYEPIHGSAPDIAGQGIANPIGAILSCALLLRHSGGAHEAAAGVEAAVFRVLEGGARTRDIATKGRKPLSTRQMGDRILEALELAETPAR